VLQTRSVLMLVGLSSGEVLSVLRRVRLSRDLPSSLTAALAHPGNAPFTLHCQQLIYMSDDSSVGSHDLALCRKHFWALLSVMYVKHVLWSINVPSSTFYSFC
jgi:hypothetical protein